MKNSIEKIVQVLKCRCNACGKEFEVYRLSDFIYGERIILTEDGAEYAYVNCIDDKVYDEVGKIVDSFYENKKEISKIKIAEYFNKVFGLSCDLINGKVVDAGRVRHTCIYCYSENINIHEEIKPVIKNVTIPVITHYVWEQYSEKEKIEIIFNALKKRGCL